jgi:hypothetical protein
MIMKVVASGKLKLEDYCHQYFDYWTKDPRDPRSRLQLHHLLSFTSGKSILYLDITIYYVYRGGESEEREGLDCRVEDGVDKCFHFTNCLCVHAFLMSQIVPLCLPHAGYYQLTYGAKVPCFRNSSMDYLECVKELYDTVPIKWEPGTRFIYGDHTFVNLCLGQNLKREARTFTHILYIMWYRGN